MPFTAHSSEAISPFSDWMVVLLSQPEMIHSIRGLLNLPLPNSKLTKIVWLHQSREAKSELHFVTERNSYGLKLTLLYFIFHSNTQYSGITLFREINNAGYWHYWILGQPWCSYKEDILKQKSHVDILKKHIDATNPFYNIMQTL